jgi:hypothetical protein
MASGSWKSLYKKERAKNKNLKKNCISARKNCTIGVVVGNSLLFLQNLPAGCNFKYAIIAI